MSDIEWAHIAYFETSSGREWDPCLQVEESHDLGIRAVIAATREQVAREIEAARTDVVLDHGGDTTDVFVRGVLLGLERALRLARGDS